MIPLEKPLFYFGSAYLWTLMLLALTGVPFASVLLTAAVFAAVYLAARILQDRNRRGKRPFFLATALLICLACAAFLLQTFLVYRPALAQAGEETRLTGYVTEVLSDSSSGNHRCVLAVRGPGTVRRVQLSTKTYVPKINDTIDLSAALFVLGEDDPELAAYYRSRGIYLGAYVSDRVDAGDLAGHPVRQLIGKVLAVRARWTGSVSEWLPDDLSSVLNAMFVGDKTTVPEEAKRLFQRSGVLHLFAVSGFHTSLWSMLLYKLLLRLGAGRRTSCAGVLLFLLFFVTLTGFSRSAVRAGIMLGLFFLGRMLLRTSDPLNALGLAVFCILLPNPFYGGDAGLLLSYFATLGILAFYPALSKAMRRTLNERIPNRKIRRRAEDLCAVALITLCTIAATLPVVFLWFGNLSLVSVAANLLVSAAASFAILATGIGAMLSAVPVLKLLTPWCYLSGGLVAKYLLAVCGKLAALPFAYVNLTGAGFGLGLAAALLVAVSGFVLYGMLPDGGLVRVTALLSAVVLLGSVLTSDLLERDVIKVSFADTQGTCILVTCRGEAHLIGCGGEDYPVTKAVRDVFAREGVSRLSSIIVPRDKKTEAGALAAVRKEQEPAVLLKPEDLSGTGPVTVDLFPRVTLRLYAQNGDRCAGLLDVEGVRFLLLFRPTVDLSQLPPEARAVPVTFVRGNPPQGLKSGPSSYIIVSGETGFVEARVTDGRFRLYRR